VGVSNGLGFLLSYNVPPEPSKAAPSKDNSQGADQVLKSFHSIPELLIESRRDSIIIERQTIEGGCKSSNFRQEVHEEDDFCNVLSDTKNYKEENIPANDSKRDETRPDKIAIGDTKTILGTAMVEENSISDDLELQKSRESNMGEVGNVDIIPAINSNLDSVKFLATTLAEEIRGGENVEAKESSVSQRTQNKEGEESGRRPSAAESNRSASLSPILILKSPIFWLYCSVCVFQQGLTYMSNISLIVYASSATVLSTETLAAKTTLHLTLLSVFQSLGRFSFGLLSDVFKTAKCRPLLKDCTWLVIIAQLQILLPVLILGFGGVAGSVTQGALIFCSISMGFGFGAAGACFPVLAREYFGMRYYGTACGFLMGLVPLGILLSNTIFGQLYDAVVAKSGGGTQCHESLCFSTSFIIFSFIQMIPCTTAVILLLLREKTRSTHKDGIK
jgi:hypothetical protein